MATALFVPLANFARFLGLSGTCYGRAVEKVVYALVVLGLASWAFRGVREPVLQTIRRTKWQPCCGQDWLIYLQWCCIIISPDYLWLFSNARWMQRLRSRLGAWWLLMLLGRVMAPEAAVLSLHVHHHTVHEKVRPATRNAFGRQAKLSTQHQHCHTEQLYNAPFQPTLPPAVPLPRVQPVYSTHHALIAPCPARHLLPGAALRGPPMA